MLAADLEIRNIPEERTENITHTVVLVAAKLGVSLDERDIVFADRVKTRKQGDNADGDRGHGPRVVVHHSCEAHARCTPCPISLRYFTEYERQQGGYGGDIHGPDMVESILAREMGRILIVSDLRQI
ncbi:unnamed protein product [Parnassius apollo]|uniref:(apollo) hypothetical protein n=1 Tax=Parnassius apollo TaxID=110799 RepID=A0A8S3XAL1_PARAO|nr:unnamed protein product [Parnassius apollo]